MEKIVTVIVLAGAVFSVWIGLQMQMPGRVDPLYWIFLYATPLAGLGILVWLWRSRAGKEHKHQ